MTFRICVLSAAICIATWSLATAREPIVVAYNSDWGPYSKGQSNEVHGILPEVLDQIFKSELNMAVKHVGYPLKRVLKGVETGAVDAMISIPTPQRRRYAIESQEGVYRVELRSVERVKHHHAPIMATIKPSKKRHSCRPSDVDWKGFLDQNFNVVPVIESKIAGCLRMVASKRVDLTIMSTAVAQKQIVDDGLQDRLIIMPKVWGQPVYKFMLSKNSRYGNDFLARFDETLRNLKTTGAYQDLMQRAKKTKPAS